MLVRVYADSFVIGALSYAFFYAVQWRGVYVSTLPQRSQAADGKGGFLFALFCISCWLIAGHH